MKSFEIEFENAEGRFLVSVEAWTGEQAREIFNRDNPGCEIIQIAEE